MDYKNGMKKHMASLHKPANGWFSNAVKSMGLSSGDLIKELAPSMYEFSTNTSRDAMALSKELRSSRIGVGRIKDTLTNSPYFKTSKDLIRNSMDDLKSGKFVNPDREKQMDEEFEKRFMGDMDGMFNMDDLSFGDEDTQGATINNNNVYNENGNDSATLFMAQAMKSNTETQIKMTETTLDTMVSIASNVMLQTKEIGQGILSHLGSINDNLSAMVEYNSENMTKYIEASLAYYEQTAPKKKDEYEGSSKLGYGDLLNSKGTLNAGQYGKYIKQNLKKSYSDSMYGGFIDLLIENPEMLLGSPLKMLMVGGMKTLVPKMLSNSLKSLDKSFSNFFPTLLGKMSDWESSDNPLLRSIGGVAGAKEKRVTKFKLGEFERGSIPFDGVTKHAIVEVIPTYLRKILSSLNGKEEMSFNWEKGKYEDVSSVKDTIYSSIKNNTLNEFKYSSDIDSKISKNRDLLIDEDAKKFDDLKDKFYLQLEKSTSGFFNPVDDTKDSFKDIMGNIDSMYGSQLGNLLRASFKTLSKEDIMSVNKVRNSAKKSRRETVDAMQYDPYYYGIYNLADDEDIDKEIAKRGTTVNAHSNTGGKHKSESLNYLSDIKGILLRGINVRMQMGSPFENSYSHVGSPSSAPTPNSDAEVEVSEPLSQSDKETRQYRGYFTESVSNQNLSTQDMVNKINNKNAIDNQDVFGNQHDPDAENTRTFGGRARNKLRGVANPLANSMNKANDFIYGLLFGSTNQLFDTISVNIADKLTTGFNWIQTKIFTPLKDAILGEKDENGYMQSGILSHLQNTTKDFMNEAMRSFSGKGYVDGTGKNVEALAPGESIVGKVRGVFRTIKDDTMTYLFGSKDEETGKRDKDGGLIKRAGSSITEGFNDFRELLFGAKKKSYDKDGNEITKSFKDEIMEKMPKTVSGTAAGAAIGTVSMFGGTGLLGSLFLPGGPIAGAIVGSALGFVSQSEKFKEMVFGKDTEDGKHIEGWVSKKTQDFFKENKAYIKGGAAFGLAKTAIFGGGLMSNLMFGPFTGAVLGAGLGILKRSKLVQEIMYGKGEEGEEGYKKGVINSIKEKLGHQDFKKTLGYGLGGSVTGFLSAATIGKMGIIGSMLTPMGPLGGAILGGAIGIASTNEKVKDFLFGEMGDDKKRDGGLVGKVKNYVSVELFQPLKLKMQEMGLNVTQFLDQKLAEPVRRAIEPFAHQMKLVGETIKAKFVEIKDNIVTAISDTVVKPMAEGLNKYILDPLKNLSSKLFNGMFKLLGTVISAPFALLSATTSGLVKGHKEKALDAEKEEIWKRKDPNKGFLGNTWANVKDTVKNYGTKSGREKAYANQSPYLVNYEEDIKTRETERSLLYASKHEQLETEKAKYRRNQEYARANGYLDIDSNNDVQVDPATGEKRGGRLWNALFRNRKKQSERDETQQDSRERHDAPHDRERARSEADRVTREDIESSSTDATVGDSTETTTQGGKKRRRGKGKKNRTRNRVNNDFKSGNVKSNTESDGTDTDAIIPEVVADDSSDSRYISTRTAAASTSGGSVRNKKLPNYGSNMLKYVKDIRDEVKGQLNGVGLNIFKIRKTIGKRLGVSDDGDEGSDNLEGVGILDKIGNFLQRPIKNITAMITRPFKFISETAGKIKQGFVDFWTGLKSIPGKIVSGIGTAIKTTFSFIGDGLKFAGGLVRDTVSGITGVAKGAIKGVGVVVSATMAGVTNIISGLSKAVGSIIGGIAEGVGKVIGAIPGLIGGTVEALGMMGAGLIKGVGHVGRAMLEVGNAGLKVMSTAAQSMIGIVGKLGEATVKLIATPIKLAASAIGSVAGFVGDLFTGGRRNRQKIEFIGGKIDRIVDPVYIEGDNDKLVNVRIVETTSNLPVDFGDGGWKKVGDIIRRAIGGNNSDTTTDETLPPGTPKPQNPIERMKQAFRSIFSGGYREETITTNGMDMINVPPIDDGNNTHLPNLKDMFSGLKGKIGNGINPKGVLNKAKSLFSRKKNGEEPVKRTALVEIAEKAKKRASALKDTMENMKIKLLGNIDKSTNTHMLDWAYMFGKKGLVTAGLLALLPLAYKLFKKFMDGSLSDILGSLVHNITNGFQNNGNPIDRTKKLVSNATGTGDKDGDGFVDGDLDKDGNYSIAERMRQFYTGGDKDGDPDTIETDHLTGAKLNVTKTLAVKGARNFNKFKDNKFVQKASSYVGAKVSDGLHALDNSKILNTTFDKTKEFITDIKSSDKVTKIVQMCKDAIDVLKTKLLELVAKMSKGAKGELLEKVIAKVTTCLKPEILVKYLGKFGKVAAKGALAAGTVALSELAWFSVGAVDGAFTASNLFQVDDSIVDGTMTAISAIFRGFLNTTVGSVLDIINEISYEILGFSFVTEIATATYKTISSKEDSDKLQISRDDFMNEYKEYKTGEEDKAYQKYLDENPDVKAEVENDPDKYEATKQEYIKNNPVDTMSVADYNEEKHPGFFKKASNSWNNTVRWTKSKLAWAGDKWNGAKESVKNGLNWVGNEWDREKKVVGDGIDWAGAKLSDGAQWAGDKLSQGANWAKDKLMNNTPLVAMNDDKIRSTFGLNDGVEVTMKNRISSGIGSAISLLSGGLIDQTDASKTVQGAIIAAQNTWGSFKDKMVQVGQDVKDNAYKLDQNVGSLFGLHDADGNSLGFTQWAGGKIDTLIGNVGSVAKSASNYAKGAWTSISDWSKNKYDYVVSGSALADADKQVGSLFGLKDSEGNPLGFSDWAGNKVNTFLDGVSDVAKKGSAFAKDTWNSISGWTGNKYDYIVSGSALADADKQVGKLFGLHDPDGNAIGFSDWAGNKVNTLLDNIGEIAHQGANWAKDTWTSAKDKMSDWKDSIAEVAEEANKKIGGMFGLTDTNGEPVSFTTWAKEKTEVMLDSVKDTANTVIEKGKDFWSWLTKNRFSDLSDEYSKQQNSGGGNISDAEVGGGGDDTYYSQKDGPWAGMQYGTDKTMSDVGCGPTTAAMLISNVTGEKITPDQTAQYAIKNGYLVNNKGTSWDYFNNVGNQYGVNMKQTGNFQDVQSALSGGHPVVLTGNGGAPYTKGGHYIMAKGYDANGNILVSDPLGKMRNKAYSPELLQAMTSQAWISDKGSKVESGQQTVGASVFAAGTNKITMGESVVNSARKLIGLPYVYGGNYGPLGNSEGTDCSGLAQWAYNDSLGKSIPRTTYTQLDGLTEIDGSNLQPGDLIYPNDGHVYMYSGDNKVIEAQKTGTTISEHEYTRKGSKFRRVLENPNAYIDGSGSSKGSGTKKQRQGGIDKSDTFGAISQFMSEYSERAYMGALTGKYNTDYDEFFNGKEVETSTGSSSSGASVYTPGSDDDVASKLVDIISVGEGDYDTVVPDDVDAFSFGIMGFHKEYAAEVLNRMANRLSGDDADTARYYAGLANGALSSDQAAGLKEFLNRPSVKNISQEEQKKMGMELVKSRNLPTVLQMLKDGRLKDSRSAILVADIGNTGPAHIDAWAKNYTPAASKDEELAHVRESLKSSDSYWGRQVDGGQSQYYQGWMNRIDRTYDTLSSQSGGGGNNPLDISPTIKSPNQLMNMQQYGGGGEDDFSINPIFSNNQTSSLSNNMIQKIVKDTFKPTSSIDNSTKSYDLGNVEGLLNKIASYLESISSSSTDSANTLRKLKISTDTVGMNSNNQSNNPIILNNGSNQNNANIGNVSKNEALARRIAKGLN